MYCSDWKTLSYVTSCLIFQLCKELAEEFDKIREEYWNYISRSLLLKYGSEATGHNNTEGAGDAQKASSTLDYIDNIMLPSQVKNNSAKIEEINDESANS